MGDRLMQVPLYCEKVFQINEAKDWQPVRVFYKHTKWVMPIRLTGSDKKREEKSKKKRLTQIVQ